MKYEVFARKWRPQQFDDVVGQEHVTATLKNAINSDRLAHAYLLVGPRGIGKTSIARIFAKALNCSDGPTVTPCDKCDSCREIAAGSSLDVQEIDGASNNSVEQVRDLRETVKYAPSRGNYKIYIIDEVHMLSTAAFNALLKTLEEPPPHVKFLFATTEPEKILPTILSRCQRFDLKRIPVNEIVSRLNKICEEENIEADGEALFAVARGAEGGLRDAESALDQLVSFRGQKIGEDDVLSVFGLASRKRMEELAGYILGGDVSSILRSIDELDKGGKDLQRVALDLIAYFRDLLVCMHLGKDAGSMDLMSSEVEQLAEQARRTDTEKVLRFTDILGNAENRMRHALSKRTLLETALVRCSRAATVASVEQILAMINDIRGGTPVSVRETQTSYGSKPAAASQSGGGDMENLKAKWGEVVEHAARMSVIVRTALKNAKPVAVDGNEVTIGFDPEFAANMERFDQGRNRQALERALGSLLGRQIKVRLQVLDGGSSAGTEEAGENATPPSGPGTKQSGGGRKKNRRDLLEDPAVQKTLETFNGSIVDIRE
jgi:DNA polymerase-3 subunit gamma/tau